MGGVEIGGERGLGEILSGGGGNCDEGAEDNLWEGLGSGRLGVVRKGGEKSFKRAEMSSRGGGDDGDVVEREKKCLGGRGAEKGGRGGGRGGWGGDFFVWQSRRGAGGT